MISLSGIQRPKSPHPVEIPSPLLSHRIAATATLLDMMASGETVLSRAEVALVAKRLRKIARDIPTESRSETRG